MRKWVDFLKTIILVRHGESESNIEKRFTGQLDSPLTMTGNEQARLTAKYLDKYKIDKIYSSPLVRAYNTGDAISKRQNCPIKKCSDLAEINGGAWQGLTFDEISEKYPDTYKLWRTNLSFAHPDGGESVCDIYTRVINKFQEILLNENEKTVCIAAHALPIRMIESFIKSKTIECVNEIGWVPNASVCAYTFDGEFTVIERGVCDYLGEMVTNLPKNI